MNERQMEIIISRGIELVLGSGHELKAQQVGVGDGRLDLLVSQPNGTPLVVELKKGRLASTHVEQVITYAADLAARAGANVDAMLIVNEASPKMVGFAESQRVNVITIPESRLRELAERIGLSETDLLGDRRRNGVLFSGGSGLRTSIPLEVALAECPHSVRRLATTLGADFKHLGFRAGTSQIVAHYRGIKVGGLNRHDRGGHTYIATGVVLSTLHEQALKENGFCRMTRNTTGKHEHVWWERRWEGSEYTRQSERMFRFFFKVIDEALRLIST